jgi:hypothetical protein
LSSLPAETRPDGCAPGGRHAAREHGSTCQLSALPHGAPARTTACMFGSQKTSDRSSELRSFGLSEADHSGILSGSRPMQQRLVCVEAGQTFSIQRMEVLTPQVSSIHCRLTRGWSLVRSQSGPSQVLAGKAVGRRSLVILVVGRAARYWAISGHRSTSQKRYVVRVGVGACDSVGFGTTRMGFEAGCEGQGSPARGAGGGRACNREL